METKSRYEVISDLERQKRDLIRERDGFTDKVFEKERAVKDLERKKSDTIVIIDRQLDDLKVDLEQYKKTMDERKVTVQTLIDSIDTSLAKFGSQKQ